MEYVFVKDSEGYVFRKPENEVSCDEKIISEKEYRRKSGLAMYEKKFGHTGEHVAAWSKGGATDISNCQMLCKSHNRAKGNR